MTDDRGGNIGVPGALSAATVLVSIALASFLSIRAMGPPKAVLAAGPAEEFSAERAFGLLKEIAAEPHPLGTPAHDKVRDTILRMWRSTRL